jgi:YVTN family beta-propeller protein
MLSTRGVRRTIGALCALLLLGVAAPVAQAREAYVTNPAEDTVSVLDTTSGSVTGTIPVGGEPTSIAMIPDGRRAFVVNRTSNDVSVIETATDRVVATIPVGAGPYGIAITPDGSRAYVTNSFTGTVTVIGTRTDNVIGLPITVGGSPSGIAVTPDGSRAYVGDVAEKKVTVIATASGTVLTTIPVDGDPYAAAVTPDGKRVYVVNPAWNNVSVISTATDTVIATIPVGNWPYRIAITPDGSRAFVANLLGESATVIDTRTDTVVGLPIAFGEAPLGIAITPDGSRAYFSTGLAGGVAVVDTATDQVVSSVPVGADVEGIVMTPSQTPSAVLAPATGAATTPTTLDASASSAPDGRIALYEWAFGDGFTTSSIEPFGTHSYEAPGTYPTGVAVDNGEGCTGFVFTGQTAYCNGPSRATATSTARIGQAPPAGDGGGITPPATNPPAGNGGNPTLTDKQLGSLMASSLIAPATLTGTKLTVKVKCPTKVGTTCDISLWGMQSKKKAATAAGKAKVKAGKTKTFALKVRQPSLAKVKASKKLLFKQTVKAGPAKTTLYKKLALAQK